MSRRTIAARVKLRSTSEEGRTGSIQSGYRSLLRFEGSTSDFGFEVELGSVFGVSGLAPGTSGTVRITFWAAQELPALFDGQRFELREGARVVGGGTVINPAPVSQ